MIEMDPATADEEAILVRKMEVEDVPAIIAIDKKISALYRPDMWESEVQHILNKPENICLVAEIQGEVVGFMIGAVHSLLFGIENGGWIEVLGVEPAQTAKGVGKKLGEKILADFRARGIKVVHTAVEWTSGDLLEFFKALGMTRSGFITLMKEL